MKKKLLTLFALFILILPISACGEDDETPSTPVKEFTVNTNLDYPTDIENDAKVYRIQDCAKISGGGKFNQGNSFTITVEYITSACSLVGWKIEGLPYDLDNPEELTNYIIYPQEIKQGVNVLTIEGMKTNNITSATITALIKSTEAKGVAGTLIFSGIKEESSSTTYTGGNNFAFHVIENTLGNSNGNPISLIQSVKSDFASYDSSIRVDGTPKLSQILIEKGNGNLEYVYKKNGENYDLLSNRLVWYEGTLTQSTCSYINAKIIENPNTYEVPLGKVTCIAASATGEHIKEDTEKSLGALSHLDKNQYYISSKTTDACLTSVDGTTPVSEDCFYVYRLKELYSSVDHTADESNVSLNEKLEHSAIYYGIKPDGHLEGINTNAGNKLYYLCGQEASSSACSMKDSYRITYPYTENENGINTAYSTLSISTLIDALINETYTDVAYKYDLNTDSIAIKSMKIGETTYYFNTIADGNYYHPDNNRNSFVSSQEASLYKFMTITNPYLVVRNGISYPVVDNKFEIDDVEYTLNHSEDGIVITYGIETELNEILPDENGKYLIGAYSYDLLNFNDILDSFTIYDMLLINENKSDEYKEEVFREKLYEALAKDGYKLFRNYIFDLTVSGTNVTLTYKDAMIENLFEDYSLIVIEKNGLKYICSTSLSRNDEDYASCLDRKINTYLGYLFSNGDENTLAKLTVLNIVEEGNTITYTLKYRYYGVEEVTIVYDKETKEFTIGDTKIGFTNIEPSVNKLNVNTITTIVETVIGDVKQVLTIPSDPTAEFIIETYLGDNLYPDATVEKQNITDIANLVKNAAYYDDFGGDKVLVITDAETGELTPYIIDEVESGVFELERGGVTYILTFVEPQPEPVA